MLLFLVSKPPYCDSEIRPLHVTFLASPRTSVSSVFNQPIGKEEVWKKHRQELTEQDTHLFFSFLLVRTSHVVLQDARRAGERSPYLDNLTLWEGEAQALVKSQLFLLHLGKVFQRSVPEFSSLTYNAETIAVFTS